MLKTKIKPYLAMLFLVQVFFQVNCDPDLGIMPVFENPVPALIGISPNEKVAHLPAFTLKVTGADFFGTSKIVFDGVEKETIFISNTELSCTINPKEIVGSAVSSVSGSGLNSKRSDSTVPVLVRNPSPGGGDSDTVMFTIYNDFMFTTSQALPMGAMPVDDPVMDVAREGYVSLLYRSNAGGNANESMAFIRSIDSGGSWTSPATVAGPHPERVNGFGTSFLSVDFDGNLHAMILEDYYYHEVNYCYSTDNGATWSKPSYVASDLYGHGIERLMEVDPFGGINFIIMKYDVAGHSPVWFKRSTDFGATFDVFTDIWIGWEEVYDSTGGPDMVVDNNHGIFASFTGTAYTNDTVYGAIYYNYSLDSGTTWNTVDTVIGPGRWAALAKVPNGNVHIFVLPSYYNDSNNHITHYHSTDQGITWETGADITTPGSGESKLCVATDAAGNINLLYDKGFGYFFRRSIDNGATWLDEIPVIQDATGLDRGKIKTDEAGNIYFIIYNDVSGYNNIDYGPVYLVKGL
jgi:BNR/Asp-box repeat